jgi:hypothetical protein
VQLLSNPLREQADVEISVVGLGMRCRQTSDIGAKLKAWAATSRGWVMDANAQASNIIVNMISSMGQDCEWVCILALKVERGLRDASDQDWLAYFQRFSVHLPFEDNVSVVVCSVELNFH